MRIWLVILTFSSSATWAQAMGGNSGAASAPGAWLTSAMAMVLMSSTKQGGQGPQGSTILTHTQFQFNKAWWGAGLYFQFDKHGDSQTDTGVGPKVELNYAPFYLEIGYTFMVDRGFTDRSIAKQSGDGMLISPGIRFPLAMGGQGGGKWLFEASYKYRTQKIAKQDGVAMDEPIEQTDGYPVFGVGYQF